MICVATDLLVVPLAFPSQRTPCAKAFVRQQDVWQKTQVQSWHFVGTDSTTSESVGFTAARLWHLERRGT